MSNQLVEIGDEFDLKSAETQKAEVVATQPPPQIKIPQVKKAIPIEEIPEELRGKGFTPEHIEQLAALMNGKYDKNKGVQLTPKDTTPVVDYTKLSIDDVYNMDVFIEAKSFMSGDPLKVKLVDANYEPRWVNKKSERLGYMKSIGFQYVVKEDLAQDLEVEISGDAEGHFGFHDVVLMKVPKSSYYAALRASHIRAQNVVDRKRASERGAAEAGRFMQNAKDDSGHSVGGDFAEAQQNRHLEFYQPGA